MNESLDQRDPIEALAEDFMERKRRGEQPTLEEYIASHPEVENEIRELFPAFMIMENLGAASSARNRVDRRVGIACSGDPGQAAGRLQDPGARSAAVGWASCSRRNRNHSAAGWL